MLPVWEPSAAAGAAWCRQAQTSLWLCLPQKESAAHIASFIDAADIASSRHERIFVTHLSPQGVSYNTITDDGAA